MSKPNAKVESKSSLQKSGSSSIMVGLIFDGGIVLANSMLGNIVYYLSNRIYCCASNSSADRKAMLEVATKVDEMSRTSMFSGCTVGQILDLLCKKYEQHEGVEMLLAGNDANGLHLLELKPYGASKNVRYAALGEGAEEANAQLSEHYHKGMSLEQAQQLARQAVLSANVPPSAIDVCIIFKFDKRA